MRAQELGNEKLVIFDIDDTLVNTDTRVNVVKDGKVIKQLNSHDFTHYKLQPGETFDFGAFRDAREFFTKARPIPGMIKQLKHDIATGNRVIMLTARSDFNDRDVFLDTFRRFGIDMDRVHVYRAGNLAIKAATEEKKKIILKHLLGKEHFDKLIMYDDSVPNLNAFLSLRQEYPWSKFYAWHVDPNGQASEYSRAVDESEKLQEITRRDFLRGAGALAGSAALGSAGAQSDQDVAKIINSAVMLWAICKKHYPNNPNTRELEETVKRLWKSRSANAVAFNEEYTATKQRLADWENRDPAGYAKFVNRYMMNFARIKAQLETLPELMI